MKRRKFIATSTGILGMGSTIGKIGSQPAVGVTFDIPSKLTKSQVTNNNIIVTLSNITIKTSNLSDTNSNIILDIQVDTDINTTGFTSVKQYGIDLTKSSETVQIPSISVNLGSKSNLDYANARSAQLRVVIKHPDIRTKYTTQNFIIDGDLLNGLIAYYPMEKGAGRILHDATSNNYNGTINRATWNGSGNIGNNSLSFDNANNEYAKLPAIPDISDTSSFTISLWIYYRSGSSGSLLWFNENGNFDNAVGILNEDSGNYQYYVEKNGTRANNYNFGEQKPQNKWSHIVLTFDNSTARFYENGSEIDSNTGPSVTPKITEMYVAGDIYRDEYVDAMFDDIRIYNRKLSQTEIEDLYNLTEPSGNEITESDVPSNNDGGVARYDFNGDVSNNWSSNNSTNNGVEFVSNAVYRQSARFNGTSSYIDPPKFDLNNDQSFSWSVWINHNSDGFDTIVGKYDENSKYHYFRVQSSSDRMIMTAGDTEGTYETLRSEKEVPPNEWHHIVSLYDNQNNKMQMYIDGKHEKTITATPSDFSMENGVDIGRRSGDNVEYFSGEIDDLRLYAKPLTSNEVKKLFRLGSYRIP